MTPDQILATVWRRKLLVLLTFVLCVGTVVAVTLSLPKTYKATATLYVGQLKTSSNDPLAAVDPNTAEQLSRTYTTLASHPNVADEVVTRLPYAISRDALLERMSFAPVERTQLLQITASGPTAERAQELANLYSEVFIERADSRFSRREAPSQVSLSEPAARPGSPSAPKPSLYIGFGVILSALLAAGTALLRERFDDSMRLDDIVDSVLGHPVLLRIPAFDRTDARKRAAVADSFRLLKANVDFLSDERAQVIAITSARAVEGKSTTAAELALTAAADGEEVVLIEADLRRPGICNTEAAEGLDPTAAGLTNVLVGVASLDDVLVVSPRRPGLSIIWAGPTPPNPGALLRSDRFSQMIAELRTRFDRIIIDTSPIAVGADASLTVARADGTLFVIDSRTAQLSAVTSGLSQLETIRARVLGVVLNRTAAEADEVYGYYAPAPTLETESGGSRRRRS